jgi:hypothetical protein
MSTQNPTVQLYPVRHGGTFNHWEMSVDNGVKQGPPYPQLTVHHGNNADLSFTIVDPQGIEFQPYNPPTSTPIYIQPGIQKPTSGIDGDIGSIHVKDDPKTGAKNAVLNFHDGNQKAAQLSYVLNFKNADKLDPIVNNGGGGPGVLGGRPNGDYLWYAAGAVAMLVLLVAILAARRRHAPMDPAVEPKRVQPKPEGEKDI